MATEAIAIDDGPGRDAAIARPTPWNRGEAVAAVANGVVACAIVVFFHNTFWWPADDGAYAYVADALRNGAVLNRDVHDVHGGYVHFVHALTLDVFGRDIVSLRYPLAFLTVVQSVVVFLLLRPSTGAAAIVGGMAMSALTFVQFINPTANWYALFLAVAVAAMLAARIQRRFAGLVAIGIAIGAVFLFRQLTGVLVGMGALAWLLTSEGDEKRAVRPVLAPAAAAVMALGLAAYFWLKVDGVGFALYGLWPLAFLTLAGMRTRVDNQRVAQIFAGVLSGTLLAAAPLFLYHAGHGSLVSWWHDTIVAAVALTELDFFGQATYATILSLAVYGVANPGNPADLLNGAFWLVAVVSPTFLGIAVVRSLLRDAPAHPLAVLALFYAVVSAHYAIPIYAIYSTGLVLAGLIAMSRTSGARFGAVATTLFAVAVGLWFQAAQPLSRGTTGTVLGTRVPLDADGVPGASIWMERRDHDMYTDLVGFIASHAAPGDSILGLPMTPQLYFLSGRKSALRSVIVPLGLLTDDDVDEAWSRLRADMPAVVIFRPDDKYTTPLVRALMTRLSPHYRLCNAIGGFELYAPACRSDSGGSTGLYGS